MRRLRAWLTRLAGILPSARREREIADELEAHLELHVEDNVRSGMTPEDARRDAVLKLGGVEATKEAWRDRSTVPFLDNLLRDVRFAIRQLRANPGFSVTAVLMLALGICASVAIFAFVDAALIKPLPYRDPARLVGVYEALPLCPRCNLSYLDYLDWKRLNTVFGSLDAYQRTGLILSTPSGAQPARAARVSDGIFRTLGVTPALGRDFQPGEDLPGAPRTTLLSHAGWQRRYGGRADVIGQTAVLDGVPHVVIGVLPRDFSFAPTEPAEFWVPLQTTGCAERRSCHNLYGVARLASGASVETALAETKAIARRLEEQYPDSNRGQGASVVALGDAIVGPIRPILLLLLGGAALLLLIAGLNVASLVLVRSESRRRELAVRGALGASTLRLVSQFVTEASVLVAAGTGLGVATAGWAMQLLAALIPSEMMTRMPFFHGVGLNARVLAFTAVVALLAIVLVSITPTVRWGSSEARGDLADGGRGSSGTTWRRLGANLVVVELATAMVLLIGAGLLGQSLYRLLHVDLGLQPDQLAIVQAAVPRSGYAKHEQVVALGRQVVSAVAAVPGVTSAGLTTTLPLGNNGNTTWFRVLGRPFHGEHNDVPQREVTAAYLTTLGATLIRGRHFQEGEDATRPPVAIVNESLARQYFPGEDPLGRQLSYLGDPPVPMEIVGIVKDVREGALDSAPRAVLYRPFEQSSDAYLGVVVRTSQDERSVLPQVAAAIHRIDPGIVTMGATTMNDLLDASPSAYMHRCSAWLVGGFAALALLLSVVGLYGVVAYSVSRRTREIGVRMALGAQPAAVHRMILGEAARLSAFGIALGVVGALAAASLLRGLLFGVRSWDVPTLAAVVAVLGSSALLASYIPARRAAAVNPVRALRAD